MDTPAETPGDAFGIGAEQDGRGARYPAPPIRDGVRVIAIRECERGCAPLARPISAQERPFAEIKEFLSGKPVLRRGMPLS